MKRLAGVPSEELPISEPVGVSQARILEQWARKNFPAPDIIFESRYLRARQTRQLVYPGCDDITVVDPELDETDRGIWYDLPEEEVRRRFPEEVKRKEAEGYFYRPMASFNRDRAPESCADALERALCFWQRLAKCQAERVAIFGHRRWKIILDGYLRGLQPEAVVQLIRRSDSCFANASATIYRRDGNGLVAVRRNIVPWQNQ